MKGKPPIKDPNMAHNREGLCEVTVQGIDTTGFVLIRTWMGLLSPVQSGKKLSTTLLFCHHSITGIYMKSQTNLWSRQVLRRYYVKNLQLRVVQASLEYVSVDDGLTALHKLNVSSVQEY